MLQVAIALLNVKQAMKIEKEKTKLSTVAKVHSIKELLAMEDSDDELTANPKALFPWH